MSSALRNFIVTFLVAAVLFGVAAYLIISGVTGALNGGGNNPGSPDGSETESESETSSVPVVDDGFTALLLGTDYQPYVFKDYDVTIINRYKDGFPTLARKIQVDSITIVKADRINRRFVFIPVPANMTVTVGGVENQLRDVMSVKNNDLSYFIEAVYGVTGIRCDYYAMTSVTNMQYVIDAIGGIEFDVPVDMNYSDPSEGLTINIPHSTQTLNGTNAVKVLRFKSHPYPDGDQSRRALSVEFMKTLFKKLSAPEKADSVGELYASLEKYFTTNFTLTSLTKHLDILFSFGSFETKVVTYPGTVREDNNSGEAYFVPDLNEAIRLLSEYR